MKLLLIKPPNEDQLVSPNLISELSGYPYARSVERVGTRFLGYSLYKTQPKKYDMYGNLLKETKKNESLKNNKDEEDEDEETSEADREAWRNKHHLKPKTMEDEDDPYVLLGISEQRWTINEEGMKKAYKKLTLKYHPDKREKEREKLREKGLSVCSPEEDEAHFKKIKNAWELLSNPTKRRIFDSKPNSGDVDERIESFDPNTQDFYVTFNKAFQAISRWAIDKPIQQLGGPDESYENVEKFYDYWFNFRSWRDFGFYDEYDPEQAESREEKRWMERNNERQRAKRKKEENGRILGVVELSFKYDPRLKKFKEQQRFEKQRQREAKLEAQRREQEELEAKKKREEEAKRLEQERLKEEKKKETKVLRKTRTRLRNLARQEQKNVFGNEGPSTENVEYLCTYLTLPRLQSLCNSLEQSTSPQQAKSIFGDEFEKVQSEIKAKDAQLSAKSSLEERMEIKQLAKEAWTDEELSLLAKGLAKYPGGLANRWQAISDMIGTRTTKEVIAKVKNARIGSDLMKSEFKEDAFTKFQNKRESNVEVKAAPTTRWDVDGAPPPSEQPTPSDSQNSSADSFVPTPQQTPTPTATSTPSAEDWSPEDQKALENALKKVPTGGSDRWDKIAELVPGKSKKECIARFKFLASLVKQQGSVNPQPKPKPKAKAK